MWGIQKRLKGKQFMSGKWKKIIWMICMVQLVIIHGACLIRLAIYGRMQWVWVFMLGALIMVIFQYGSYRRFIKECVQDLSMLEDAGIQVVFEQANEEAGNRENHSRIYVNQHIRIPFVMGFLHPAVIIPDTCMRDANLALLFMHECYHIKRHDTLYKYVMLACNCFLWFHPLAYLLRYISYRDIEISCDEMVVQGKSKEERYRYGSFLLESAGRERKKGKAYSAYWNDSKSILRSRIQAVMEEKRKWDGLARLAVVLLLLEALVLAVWFGRELRSDYNEVNKPVNEFEDVAAPPIYTDAAVQEMLQLTPVPRDSYGFPLFEQYYDLYPDKEMEELTMEPANPWQYVIEGPGNYKNALWPAVQRFWYYMENQEGFSSEYYKGNPHYTTYETIYSDLIAGDIHDAVWGIIWKIYAPDYEGLNSYQKGYVESAGADDQYVYFSMAVHIQMVEPYLFQAVGFADLEQVLEAYQTNYPDRELSDFPQLESAVTSEPSIEQYAVVSQDEKLYVELGADERIEVPAEIEWFQDAGDPLSGASTLRKECYQCDQNKIILVHGNSTQGVSAIIYENDQWKTVSVTTDFPYGLSKIYVDFPENEQVGYIYGVVERVVFQEACVLYQTTDGGNSWEQVAMSQNAKEHSLTMDFDFLTEQIGYLAIHSSSGNAPELLRTEDGGKNWEPVIFDQVPEYFCQAYAPEMQDGKLVLYVGMEGYSERKGEKAYYESANDGKSWNYKKQVFRQ